jgi:hypothetical protein
MDGVEEMKDATGKYHCKPWNSSDSRNARERGKWMKHFGACALFAFFAFSILFNPLKASADTVTTATLTFENEGPDNTADGDFTYPYNFSVNGSRTYVSMMCLDYLDDITVGESWKADVYSISAADALIGNNNFAVAAWLFNDAETATAATSNEDQLAAWGLFDSGLFGSNNAQLTAAVAEAAVAPASAYSKFQILIPVAGSQSEGGLPQTFIDDPAPSPTPEPNSLVLLGSGLLGCAGVFYRRARNNSPVGRRSK